VRDARAGEAGLRSESNCWQFRVFWLNQGKCLHPNPFATFEIRGHKSQSENQGLCKGNPQRAGSGNLSNPSGYVREALALGRSFFL